MAQVTIHEVTWQDLMKVAKRRGTKPEKLANEALREFLQRQADEDLLERSNLAAQQTSFSIRDTEEIIRQHRKRKKKT